MSDSGWAIGREMREVEAASDSSIRPASGRLERGRALVVEEPSAADDSLAAPLAAAGFEVRACPDGGVALETFVRELPDLIVTREQLAGLDGFELARRVRELSDVPVVLVAPVDGPAQRERARALGIDRVLAGPEALEALPRLARELAGPVRPARRRPRLTAAHVRQAARAALQAELARLLVECRGNLAEMARRMGRDRSTVRYHLRRFGMLAEEPAETGSVGDRVEWSAEASVSG